MKVIVNIQPNSRQVDEKRRQDLEVELRRAWFPANVKSSKSVVVRFKVNADGQAAAINIAQSSGVRDVDEAALKAITRVEPFKYFRNNGNIEVEFSFTAPSQANVE